MPNLKRMFFVAFLLLPALACAQINWNDKAVKWHGYEDGIAAAKREHKGILLVVYADWCGVCKEYSGMFFEPTVVEKSRNVVLIRLNQDNDEKIVARLGLVGNYVPRTYIMNKNQVLQPSPSKSKNYPYFLSTDSSVQLLQIMRDMKP